MVLSTQIIKFAAFNVYSEIYQSSFMTSKKYQLLMGMMLLATVAFSQNPSTGYSVWDSSVITPKGMPQQNEFWNNAYNFPAKPRNMWEIGASGGMTSVSGDVPSQLPTFGFGLHVRKAFGYIFSARLQYISGVAKGMNWKGTIPTGYANNSAWNGRAADWAGPASGYRSNAIYTNYKTNLQDLSIQGIFSVNNVRFHKNQTNLLMYVGAGVGATAYKTMVNALNEANGTTYETLFNTVYATANTPNAAYQATYKNRKDILSALKDGMDDTYETYAQGHNKKTSMMGDNTLCFSTTVLSGLAYRLGKRLNIALEDRHTFVKDDLLDGQQYQETGSLTSNWDSYNYISLGINFNLGKNSVEPLWWINPLDYVYGELNNPKHMKLPKPTYEDSDGDGVVDQLDRESNTPAGSSVDTHGVSLDTDGDGVPDSKDKQMITPTECQPVDADGVGKCPEPECCKNIKDNKVVNNTNCPCDYPSISFKGNSLTLTSDAKALLASVAAKMKANPTCNITLNGYPETSKAAQANCLKRVNAIKTYLKEKESITENRINIICEVGAGDQNTVDIKCQ